MLIKGPIPRRTRLYHILFGWHYASEELWASQCCLFHALERYLYSLSFYMITFALFSSFDNCTSCSFHRILKTEIHHLYIKSSPFLSWLVSCRLNSAKPLADTGINTSSKGPCVLPTWVSENPSHEPSIPLCPQETKSSKNSNVIVITALQRDELWNKNIEFDSSESECCVKVDAYIHLQHWCRLFASEWNGSRGNAALKLKRSFSIKTLIDEYKLTRFSFKRLEDDSLCLHNVWGKEQLAEKLIDDFSVKIIVRAWWFIWFFRCCRQK